MQTVFSNDYAKITYEEDLKILTITWSPKKMTLEDYKKPFEIGLDFMSKNPVLNYISDIRDQGIVAPDFRKWLQEVAMPRAGKTGLKRVVGVANVNVFKQYYINNVFQSAKKFGVDYKMFSTIEEAKKWFVQAEIKRA